MQKILITGANGYIGNCLFFFLNKKFKVIGVDKQKSTNKKIFQCNILNEKKLDSIFKKEKPKIVIHLAAQSLVDETINKQKYNNNNVLATNILLKVMKKNNINKILFSSTAAVYKQSSKSLTEKSKIKALSTYAKTKLICEKSIQKKDIKSVILRFFNVCSALDKPIVGEFHNPETHLIPTIVYKAIYNKKIYIYGDDFPTPDGTCIRDYIHIKDICTAIEKSTKYLLKDKKSITFNIGNNKGISNKEIINYILKFVDSKIDLEFVNRRKGDVSRLICNSNKIKKKLGWNAKSSNLKRIIDDEIKWIKKLKKKGLNRKFKNYLK